MDFASIPRVTFEKSSLVEVICQLRFAPILKLETSPTGLQERLRQAGFHNYEPRFVSSLQQMIGGSAALPPVVTQQRVEHLFGSSDGTKLIATRDFVAVDTTGYRGWKRFSAMVRIAAESVQAEFQPVRLTRIGLRYQNVIVPSALGLTARPWSHLFRPELLGLLSTDLPIRGISQQIEWIFEGGAALIRHGLVEAEGKDGYVIDSDFYTVLDDDDAPDMSAVFPRLDRLHQQAWNFFRWCLLDPLYNAMQPKPLEE